MAFSYNLAALTNRDRVRLLIPDRVTPDHIFENEELDAFLAMEGSVKTATASALETIAADQALTLKVMRLLDVQTDGRAVAEALLQRAALLREQDANETPTWDVVEMVTNDFSARERLLAQARRR